ncbi:MAG: DUF4838 domain-containing protein [Bacilli bacterium]|nr:DUF4838 domain-containing protein [Bacilli bacterium]
MIILTNNLNSDYHIVTNTNASECERFAATELAKYLYKSTLCSIPYFSDKCKKRGKEILIGKNSRYDYNEQIKNAYDKIYNDLNSLSDEAFIIREIDNEDIIIVGNSPRATLYAVYHFLELAINFKCFTFDCEKWDEKEIIMFDSLDIVFDFPFEYREAYFTDAWNSSFASKNYLNSNLADLSNKLGGKTKWYNFHHSFSDLINPNEYFDSHPEYFSMIDGKRIKEHTELCLSNPDVLNIVVKKVKQWIKDNPECKVFSVAQDEWMGHFTRMACECENCKKIDEENGSQSGSIISFVNKIAKEINKEYPDKLIHTFAYQFSRKAPTNVIPDKNVIVRLCNIECSWSNPLRVSASKNPGGRDDLFLQDLHSWSNMTNRLYIWDYAVNYRNYLLPFPNIRSMADNIKLYKAYNVKGILMEGNFSQGGKGYLDELKSYITARLLKNPNYDLNELIKEFCNAYYEDASPYIIEYLNLWEDAVKPYELWLYDDSDHPMFTDENLDKAGKILNQALQAVKNKKEIFKRVNNVFLSYYYAKITRLPLDTKYRNEMIDDFIMQVRTQGITELFERTSLDFSINVLKNSRYAKERKDWYSLYYIMK